MRTIILYEDADIIVAYKPAGIAVQTSKVGEADMASELKNYLKGGYLGVIHRLDQPVEGLLVFGKTKKASAALTAGLTHGKSDGSFNKRYYAVLYGMNLIQKESAESVKDVINNAGEDIRLTDYIIKTKDNRAQIVPENTSGAKKAVLQYRIIKTYDEFLYLADIHIDTGRFHQIRAQMSNAGLPIMGDMKYGSENSKRVSRELSLRGTALCAYILEFDHPVTGEHMSFSIEPKGDIFKKF